MWFLSTTPAASPGFFIGIFKLVWLNGTAEAVGKLPWDRPSVASSWAVMHHRLQGKSLPLLRNHAPQREMDHVLWPWRRHRIGVKHSIWLEIQKQPKKIQPGIENPLLEISLEKGQTYQQTMRNNNSKGQTG